MNVPISDLAWLPTSDVLDKGVIVSVGDCCASVKEMMLGKDRQSTNTVLRNSAQLRCVWMREPMRVLSMRYSFLPTPYGLTSGLAEVMVHPPRAFRWLWNWLDASSTFAIRLPITALPCAVKCLESVK